MKKKAGMSSGKIALTSKRSSRSNRKKNLRGTPGSFLDKEEKKEDCWKQEENYCVGFHILKKYLITNYPEDETVFSTSLFFQKVDRLKIFVLKISHNIPWTGFLIFWFFDFFIN